MSDYKETIYDLANSSWMKFGDVKVLSEKSLNHPETKLKLKSLNSPKAKPDPLLNRGSRTPFELVPSENLAVFANLPLSNPDSLPQIPRGATLSPGLLRANESRPPVENGIAIDGYPSATWKCNNRRLSLPNVDRKISTTISVEVQLTNSPNSDSEASLNYPRSIWEEAPLISPPTDNPHTNDYSEAVDSLQCFKLTRSITHPSAVKTQYGERSHSAQSLYSPSQIFRHGSPPISSSASRFSPLYISPSSKPLSPTAQSDLPSIREFGKLVNPLHSGMSRNSKNGILTPDWMCNANEQTISPPCTLQWLQKWSSMTNPEEDDPPSHLFVDDTSSGSEDQASFSLFQNPLSSPDGAFSSRGQEVKCREGGEAEKGTYTLFSESSGKQQPFGGGFSVSVM